MKRETYEQIFAPDNRSLLEIRVFDTTIADWQIVLDHLTRNYLVSFSEDGVTAPLPTASAIWQGPRNVSFLVAAMICGVSLNCQFFDVGQIQMNLLPEEVNSVEKAEAVFRVMTDIASLLKKEVLLTSEFGRATREKLREIAVCRVDGQNSLLVSRLDADEDAGTI